MHESINLAGSAAPERHHVGHSWPVAILVSALTLVNGASASAQFAVYDPATTAQNRITATLNQYLYELQQLQHNRFVEMARRLSTLTNLRKYGLDEVARWRTHGGEFAFALPYLEALISGDPSGVAYLSLSQALERFDGLDQLPPEVRRAIAARLATVDIAGAAAIAATHYTGQVRLIGRKNELPAINALENDVIDPSSEQSTTAVLDKMSGAALIGARQRQARIQLLEGMLEQLLIDSKRTRDTDAAALNMQIVTWRDRKAADEAFVAGSGAALRTWRQP